VAPIASTTHEPIASLTPPPVTSVIVRDRASAVTEPMSELLHRDRAIVTRRTPASTRAARDHDPDAGPAVAHATLVGARDRITGSSRREAPDSGAGMERDDRTLAAAPSRVGPAGGLQSGAAQRVRGGVCAVVERTRAWRQ